MASDTTVAEEIDMIVLFIKRRSAKFSVMTDPIARVISGELDDIAGEIEEGQHWEPEE